MQKNFFRIMAFILFMGGIYVFYRWQKKKRETYHQRLIFFKLKFLFHKVDNTIPSATDTSRKE